LSREKSEKIRGEYTAFTLFIFIFYFSNNKMFFAFKDVVIIKIKVTPKRKQGETESVCGGGDGFPGKDS
jgi:hypothetical protein